MSLLACRRRLHLAVFANEVLPFVNIGVRVHIGLGAYGGQPIIEIHWPSAVMAKTGVIDRAFRACLVAATHGAPFAEA